MKEDYNEAYFDGPHSNYGGKYVWHDNWIIKAKNLVDCFNPKNVIVCGCAKGFLVKAFRLLEVEAYGMDISHYALSTTPTEIMAFLSWGDIRDMPEYDANEFDLVVAIDLLEHLHEEDVPKAVSELVRVSSKFIFTRQHFEWNKKSRADKTHNTIKPYEWWCDLFEEKGAMVYKIPEDFMGRKDIPDEEWEDPEHEPFNPHEFISLILTEMKE